MASKYKLYILYGQPWEIGVVLHVLEKRGYTKVKVLKEWQVHMDNLECYPNY